MKRVIKINLIITAIIMLTLLFSSCTKEENSDVPKNDTNPTIERVVFDTNSVGYQYEDIDTSKVKAKAVYSDGSTKDILNKDLIFNTDDVNVNQNGSFNCHATYNGKSYNVPIYINKLNEIQLEIDGYLYKNEDIDKEAFTCYGIFENGERKLIDIEKANVTCKVDETGENDITVNYHNLVASNKIKVIKRLDKNLQAQPKKGTVFYLNGIISEYLFDINAKIDNTIQTVTNNITLSLVDMSTAGVKPIKIVYYYKELGITQIAQTTININVLKASIICKTYNNEPIFNFEKGDTIQFEKGKNNLFAFYFMNFENNETVDITDKITYVIGKNVNDQIGIHEVEINYVDEFNNKYVMPVQINIYEVVDFRISYLLDNKKTPVETIEINKGENFYYNYNLIIDFDVKCNIGEGEQTLTLTYDVNNELGDYILGLFDKLEFNPLTIDNTVVNNNKVTVKYKRVNGDIIKSFYINVIERPNSDFCY